MSAWLKRFGLHLAAAVGATGIFVAAAAVGANQTRQQAAIVSVPAAALRTRTPAAQRKPTVYVATPTPAGQGQQGAGPVPPTRGPIQGQPGVVEAQPGPPEEPPEADQPQPGQPQAPSGAPKPGGANPPSPRSTPRATPAVRTAPSPTPTAQKVVPERSLAGTIKGVLPDGLDVVGVGGREWRVTPAPGALIRLNGKAARLDALQAGDTVVILGQAQSGGGLNRFLAHAVTARRA